MKFLVTFSFPVDRGNEVLKDPEFGAKVHEALTDMKAEHAYFTAVNGQRGGIMIVNMNDASEIPTIGETRFQWLQADIDIQPVMTPEDLAKAGPNIEAALKKWG